MQDVGEEVIPDRIKSFLFHYIDSVEQLEILLFLASDKSKTHSTQELSNQLRSSLNSVERRLESLQAHGLIQAGPEQPPRYSFSPIDQQTQDLVRELDEIYRIKRHRVLELLFSSMRKAKFFADAFRLSSGKDKKESENG